MIILIALFYIVGAIFLFGGAVTRDGSPALFGVVTIAVATLLLSMLVYPSFFQRDRHQEFLLEYGCLKYEVNSSNGETSIIDNYPCTITGETK